MMVRLVEFLRRREDLLIVASGVLGLLGGALVLLQQ